MSPSIHHGRCVALAMAFAWLGVACGEAGSAPAGAVDTALPADSTPPSDGMATSPADTMRPGVTALPDGGGGDTVASDTNPPLDPIGDTDGDGIFDLDEVADGTDPFDPRSARAWHPEVVGHPRLFIGPEEVAAVAERIQHGAGPHAVLWARIVGRAGSVPPTQPTDGTYDAAVAVARGEIAAAAAFGGLLTGDANMTAKAAGILAEPFPDPTYLNERSAVYVDGHYNLNEAEALVAHCTAYDWLAGTPGADASAVAAARARLIARIDLFRALCLEGGGCRNLIRNEKNNHTMKPMGAVGLCAMAVPDRPTAAADFNEAYAALTWLFTERQGVAEGGYGEGWNYLLYGGQSFVQLIYAAHRVRPGGTWRLRGLGMAAPDDPLAHATHDYGDLATHPTVRGVFEGMLKARLPDGRTAPVDDGNLASPPGGFLAAMLDDDRFLRHWGDLGHAASRLLTATFSALGPGRTAMAPDWPRDVFLPEAGFSVMRSSWDADQLYVHVNHERGRVRVSGYSHEHADNLSFIVHAFGEPLIIDPGYIRWDEHRRVKYGHDHNLVLVDGVGPPYYIFDEVVQTQPTADAWLHDHAHDDRAGLTTLMTSTKYNGAELRRRFVRVKDRYVVVADQLIDADGEARDWTWQINGLAGGSVPDSAFTALPTGGHWERANAAVLVGAAPTIGAATWGDSVEDHHNVHGWKQHVRRFADATMGQGAGWAAVVLPYDGGESVATVAAIDPGDGVSALVVTHADGDVDLVALNLSEQPVSLTWSGRVTTVAAGLTWIGSDGTSATWTMEAPPIPEPEAPDLSDLQ